MGGSGKKARIWRGGGGCSTSRVDKIERDERACLCGISRLRWLQTGKAQPQQVQFQQAEGKDRDELWWRY